MIDLFKIYYENVYPMPTEENICDNVPQWMMDLKKTIPRFTPCQFYDSLCCFAITCVALSIVWFFTFFIWNTLSKTFRNISPAHKKVYLNRLVFF